MHKIVMAIHGGAGDLPYWGMNAQREIEYKDALKRCLLKGYHLLENGGNAIDAVEASVKQLEDEPLFNAGTGSAINRNREVEMDAAIMCGKTMRAGALTSVKGVKNPIVLARKIMDECEHLYLCGSGAEEFAREMKLEFMDADYFLTPERIDKWENKHREGGTADTKESGTAGAIALDLYGNVAAGTSTGGLTNKREGRVADTSVIGAGTYANNETCAVSCTGTGEYIIRTVTAHEVSSLLKYKSWTLEETCEHMLKEKLNPLGGQFGMIALDKEGSIKAVFNTERMYRAWITREGKMEIHLY